MLAQLAIRTSTEFLDIGIVFTLKLRGHEIDLNRDFCEFELY